MMSSAIGEKYLLLRRSQHGLPDIAVVVVHGMPLSTNILLIEALAFIATGSISWGALHSAECRIHTSLSKTPTCRRG